jgi:hypothetical protein
MRKYYHFRNFSIFLEIMTPLDIYVCIPMVVVKYEYCL